MPARQRAAECIRQQSGSETLASSSIQGLQYSMPQRERQASQQRLRRMSCEACWAAATEVAELGVSCSSTCIVPKLLQRPLLAHAIVAIAEL